jgi:hypothetical protein
MCARAAEEGPRRCAPPVAGARQGAQILYNHWLIFKNSLLLFIKKNESTVIFALLLGLVSILLRLYTSTEHPKQGYTGLEAFYPITYFI